MKDKSEKIVSFLKKRKAINIRAIENDCNLPITTIDKALSGKRNIPEKYFDVLEAELKKYGYK